MSLGIGGTSGPVPIGLSDPCERRDIFDATENREYRYWS